ncbi:restriction endonuclease subunit S [Mycoplasma sp. 888]|uniref:restriction endonuclease subunit S n=1 Tax=Mycoplasma sp. 888 TaxID=3108483 RepID=UPI002D76801F|nr:restriction endonuclease subunit S [Mycoplasma sp. 888]WRQ25578.1 restriction endonuclease subunit S [Mycoplasma sp. 888]
MKNENQTNFSIENFLKANNIKNVQIKKLYEVTIWSKSFANFDKTKLLKSEINYKSILSKETKELVVENGDIKLLTTYPSDMFTSTNMWDGDVYEEEIVYIPSGGNPYVQYYNGKFINAGNIIGTSYDKNVVLTKYVYYFLKSKNDLIAKAFRGSGIKHPYMPEILEIEIPIPSIEVQTQVVNILDIFSSYAEKLKARSTQYEYYRNSLLSNPQSKEEDVRKIKIDDLINYEQPSKYLVESDRYFKDSDLIPVLTANNTFILGYTNETNNIYPASNNPVIIFDDFTTSSKWVDFDFKVKSSALKILTSKNSEILNLKYFYYWLNSFTYKTNEHKRHWISEYENIQLSLPSIKIQNKIVNTLDNFEAICKDLKIGLPAEEIKRQQQYEFYRNSIFEYLETNSFEKLMRERERERR